MINTRWFSPLDSTTTEIARYSQAILPFLHKHFSLGLVSDGVDDATAFQCENPVVGMEPINIYNIGNSHLHCSILRLSMQKPGVVILHDVSLFELALAYARKHADFPLRDLIIEEHGFYAVKAFDQIFSGSAYEWCGRSQADYDNFVTSYPLFQSFISNARGIVVHSDFALKRVKKVYRGPVLKLELPYAVPSSRIPLRQHEEPCHIVFCGHAGPNRRLREFIQAWAATSQPDFFRLSLYGAIDKADEIMALAEKLGVAELVNIIGFVSEEQLDSALSDSHMAVNLRYPTMGETSASQLRYWSKGLPSIVSDIGWYSELPHDVVMKVSPKREQQDIISILEQFISGGHPYYDYGVNGYKHLSEKHSIERYVSRLAEHVAQIEKNRFRISEVDERLIGFLGAMCDELDDSVLFENVINKISETFNGIEQVQSDR
ncbi:MAG: glycosyltransferase [Halioglobus sp.]|nr:glycosyltransferase [Halioglobus sp.]